MVREDTLEEYMKGVVSQFGDKKAVIDATNHVTYDYNQFQKYVNQIACGLLAFHVKKGEHIGILAPNSPEWMALFLAITKIGGVAVCLNAGINKRSIQYAIQFTDVTLVFTTKDMIKLLELGKEVDGSTNLKQVFVLDSNEHGNLVDGFNVLLQRGKTVPEELQRRIATVSPYDVAVIQLTSGTTGNPKAVENTQISILNNALATADGMGYTNQDIILLGTPLYHILGYVGSALTSLVIGATLVLMEKYQTIQALQIMEREHCTSFHGVPTMYQYLIQRRCGYKLKSLRKGMIAGSFCTTELVRTIFNELRLDSISNIYGQTECLSIGQIKYVRNEVLKEEKPFELLEGVSVRVVDVNTREELPDSMIGELLIQTPYLMKSYYHNEKATNKSIRDGWLYTGDLGSIIDERHIHLVGRKSDIIIRAGENIAPKEIEKVMGECKGIREVAVAGVSDSVLGEAIAVFLVLEDKANVTEDQVMEFAKKHLSKQELPQYVRFVDQLPYTESGKVKKFELVDALEKEEQQDEYLMSGTN